MSTPASTAPADGLHRRGELKPLLSLAWPLIGNNLAIAGMNFSDAVMAGRLGGVDLAAVAVGNSVWIVFFLAALGVLSAISPLVSHCFGAGSYELIGSYVRQGAVIAVFLAAAMFAVLNGGAGWLLATVGIDPEFRALAVGYIEAIAWGAPAICVYLVMRFMLEGTGRTRPVFVCTLIALVANVAGNYVFIYGHLGAPALGAVGCGVASAIAMWIMSAALLSYAWRSRHCDSFRIFERRRPPPAMKREILGLGVPISANIVAEAGLFSSVSLLMGTLSANAAAAHQIAINFAATMFMVPLAIASATTVRVGHALGRGQHDAARRRGYVGIACCAVFMSFAAVSLLIFRDQIVAMYTSDRDVSSIAISLLFVAAIFQISDGVQVGTAGALRGFKDTRVPLLMNLTAYWIVGFPLSWSAAHKTAPTPQLVWVGFVVGLSIAATLLLLRYAFLTRVSHR